MSTWGVVSVDQQADGAVDLSGVFIRSSLALPSASLINAYQPELDVCTFSNDILDSSDVTEIPDLGVVFTPEFVSAGEVIPFTGASGSYAELHRNVTPAQTIGGFTTPEFTAYIVPEGVTLTGPVPSDLSFSIPGDVFPAFANVAVPAVEALQVQSPANGEAVTPTTTFTWTAGSTTDAVIEISVTSFNAQTMSITSLDCQAVDDGSFSIPADVQVEMGAGFSAFGASMSRSAYSALEQGGAVLIVSNSSSGTTAF